MDVNSSTDNGRLAPTFDQLSVFLTVVEAGGFSAAARRLNRQQSAVSYTIAALEAQLGGIALFDRATRRPTLTKAGHAVLIDARRIALEVNGLRARVEGLRAGVEAELGVVMDAMVPAPLLVAVLAAFRLHYPKVVLRLSIEVLGGVPACVLDRTSDLGISGPLFYAVEGLERARVGSTLLVPVAVPGHPLAEQAGPIPNSEARKHAQIVLTDRSELSQGRDFAVLAAETVRVSDLAAKHLLTLAGLGWGNLPEPLVRADLAAGRLARLPLAEWHERPYPLHAIHRTDAPPGPAGRWLIERISQEGN